METSSDKLKEEFVQKVCMACGKFLSAEQCQRIEKILLINMGNLTLTKEELALSTEVVKPAEEYIRLFLAIKMVKGLSKRTLDYYEQILRKFFQDVNKPVAQITSNDIRVYLAVREMKDGVSKVTLSNELRVFRTFFSTIAAEEVIEKNPTAKIDSVKVPKRVKEPFSEMEVELIRQGCTSKRDLAIIETLYSTACRVSELCGMNRDDINVDQIKVFGKGSKERICYLTPRAQLAIRNYLEERTDDDPALFIRERLLKGGASNRLNPSGVEIIVREIGKSVGIEKCHPHRFRRTAATSALRHGMPIEKVSKMLGHEQLTTTQIYAITEESEMRNAHKKYMA